VTAEPIISLLLKADQSLLISIREILSPTMIQITLRKIGKVLTIFTRAFLACPEANFDLPMLMASISLRPV
jgi:hypothetical protein